MKNGSRRIPRSLRSRARVIADFCWSLEPGLSSSVTRKTRREPKRGALVVRMVLAAKRTLAIEAPSLEGLQSL